MAVNGPRASRSSAPPGTGRPHGLEARGVGSGILAFATLLFSIGFVTAFAGTPAGYAEYIVPFDEDVFAYVTARSRRRRIGANDTTFSRSP